MAYVGPCGSAAVVTDTLSAAWPIGNFGERNTYAIFACRPTGSALLLQLRDAHRHPCMLTPTQCDGASGHRVQEKAGRPLSVCRSFACGSVHKSQISQCPGGKSTRDKCMRPAARVRAREVRNDAQRAWPAKCLALVVKRKFRHVCCVR